MIGKKALLALAVITAPAFLGISPAAGSSCREDPSQCSGFVVPCSLDGVNPALHPEVFGNATTAHSFGFFQAPDHSWHVRPDCHR